MMTGCMEACPLGTWAMLGLVMVMTSSDWSSYTQVINIIGLLAVYDTFTLVVR